MTKYDLVQEISKSTGIEKITVLKTVESFMETVKDSLTRNKNVYLRGFGSFYSEKTCREKGKKYFKKHHYCYTGTLYSCFQTI